MVREPPDLLERFGYLCYVTSPNKTSFEKLEDVPDFVKEVIPLFVTLVLLEALVIKLRKEGSFRLNDSFASVSGGLIQELLKAAFIGGEIAAHVYVHENWRIAALPWNSVWTWIFGFIGIDFLYYWAHRAGHEINILWAVHQIHHSSEDYNLTTALRQSLLKNYANTLFYVPLALVLPPSTVLVHHHLNNIFQFWIHTEVIDKLGVLEYVLNTPSHHRVHHGRNRYCIDKNYAGTLIIWDRLFGTFQAEEDKVVYGLTHPINTFHLLRVQITGYKHVCKTFWKTKGFLNKLSVIFKGPGWAPGKPWHGYIEDIPDVHYPVEKYDVKIPMWCNIYAFLHFWIVLVIHLDIIQNRHEFFTPIMLGAVFYELLSIASIGALYNRSAQAPLLEFVRCSLYILMDLYFIPTMRISTIPEGFVKIFFRISFLSSATLWLIYISRYNFSYFHKEKKVH